MIAILLAAAALPPGTKLLDAISYQGVSVLPIVRTVEQPAASVMTLKQGLSEKLVTVREHGDVNSVVIANHGGQALLLVGGEMILGGQQDRVLGQDTLIPPHQTRTVPVYCVEHGRWSGGKNFGSAGGLVDAKVRVRAKVAHDQQRVWDEVAEKTEQMGARTGTGTYRAIGERAQDAIRPTREALGKQLDALAERKDVVGLATAVNGRIISVDAFAAPELFMQYRDRILDAAAVGAQVVAEDRAAPKATPAAVGEFMKAARTSTVRAAKGEPVYESALPAEY